MTTLPAGEPPQGPPIDPFNVPGYYVTPSTLCSCGCQKCSPLLHPFPFLKVKKLNPEAVIPARAKEGDAGYDIVAIDDGTFNKDRTYIEYRTGIAIELPKEHHAELFPRSSISKTDLVLANSVGLCDNGYRGELLFRFKVIPRLKNQKIVAIGEDLVIGTLNEDLILYKKGDKIGQIVIRNTITMAVQEVEELSETERGEGGFGSTGK
jgi:dUTP pyrophosphatase